MRDFEIPREVKRWLGKAAAESLSLELRFQLSGDYIRELLT